MVRRVRSACTILECHRQDPADLRGDRDQAQMAHGSRCLGHGTPLHGVPAEVARPERAVSGGPVAVADACRNAGAFGRDVLKCRRSGGFAACTCAWRGKYRRYDVALATRRVQPHGDSDADTGAVTDKG